jgi:hypothetical protein
MGYETVSSPRRLHTGSPLASGTKCFIASAVAAVAAATAPVANADIELGQGLSVTGFVDMSYFSNDSDGEPGAFSIDQVETDFLFAGSNGISAQFDIEYGQSASILDGGEGLTNHTFVEQAFVTKSFNDQFSVKFGRFLSYSGWETEEPTGLFQYSAAGYAPYFYGYYQQGISASYKGEKFALIGSLVNDVFGYAGGPNSSATKDIGYELGVALMPVEGLTSKLFYMKDEKTDREVFNFWTSYVMSGFTFAGEYNKGDFGTAGEGDGFLLMTNYASGPFGITLRYHDWDIENNAGTSISKVKGFTLSPSYKAGGNLLLVAEFRKDDVSAGGGDSKSFALEALFTF